MLTKFDMALTWRLAVYSTVNSQFFADFGNTHKVVTPSPLLVIFPWRVAAAPVLALRDWLHCGNNHHGYELFGQFTTAEADQSLTLFSLMFLFFDDADASMFRLCWGSAE
jgi:hypothetical protein